MLHLCDIFDWLWALLFTFYSVFVDLTKVPSFLSKSLELLLEFVLFELLFG